jgi:hypothetical protein
MSEDPEHLYEVAVLRFRFSCENKIQPALPDEPERDPQTPTKYTLTSGCTGTKMALPSGPHFNIFATTDGLGPTAIASHQVAVCPSLTDGWGASPGGATPGRQREVWGR